MDSEEQQQNKKVKLSPEEELIDRISSLPSDILCHIVSLLPTKHAACTTTLSTTWRPIFNSTPVLDFNDSSADDTNTDSKSLFIKFVDNIFSRRNFSPLSKFKLFCNKYCYDVNIALSWIKCAICSEVKDLDVEIIMNASVALPLLLYNVTTLTDLKLCGTFVIDVPDFAYLPHVKVMHVENMEFLDDDSAFRLFSRCPLLEDLTIWCCVMKNISLLKIYAASLKKLMFYGNNDTLYGVVLNAVDLEEICFSATHAVWGKGKYTFESLDRAVFHLNRYFDVSALVKRICDVRFLTLPGASMQALFKNEQPLPIFRNMTHLELLPNHTPGWKFLPTLLSISPCLEILSFQNGLYDSDGHFLEVDSYLTEPIPTCVSTKLKHVKVGCFFGEEEELKFLKYFLKNAKVLEKITISPSTPRFGEQWDVPNKQQQFDTITKLLTLPRCSKSCQLDFLEKID